MLVHWDHHLRWEALASTSREVQVDGHGGGHGGHGVSVGPVPGSSRLRTRSEFIGDARKATSGVRKSNRKDKMRADAPDVAASYLTPATSFSDEYDLGMSLLTIVFQIFAYVVF